MNLNMLSPTLWYGKTTLDFESHMFPLCQSYLMPIKYRSFCKNVPPNASAFILGESGGSPTMKCVTAR